MTDVVTKDRANQLGVELRFGEDAGYVALFCHVPKSRDSRRSRIGGIPECDSPRCRNVETRLEILIGVVEHEERNVAERPKLFCDFFLKRRDLCLCRSGIRLVERGIARIVPGQFRGDDIQPGARIRRIEPGMRVSPVMAVAVLIMAVLVMAFVPVVIM